MTEESQKLHSKSTEKLKQESETAKKSVETAKPEAETTKLTKEEQAEKHRKECLEKGMIESPDGTFYYA